MTTQDYIIAVDLGGTNLRVGAVKTDGSVEEIDHYPSEAREGSVKVLGRVAQAIRQMMEKVSLREGKIQGLSLGFPGIVDPKKGIVYQSPHFPDWKNLDLFSYFKNEFSFPVVVDNDANLAALGEGWKGAAQGLDHFVMITFGTGVGGGIVVDGRLLHGNRGFAGEVGHICIQSDGPPCACEGHGCLEMYVSSIGLMRLMEISEDHQGREKLVSRFGGNISRVTVQGLYEAALDGDIFANVLFKKMGYYLGIGIATLTNTLGIETFVLGGGVSRAWDFFIEAARKELGERTYRETASHVEIRRGILGDKSALVGGVAAIRLAGLGSSPRIRQLV